jgi:hypothetical protein
MINCNQKENQSVKEALQLTIVLETCIAILSERHWYHAKESVLHMAWEQEEWLKSLDP